MAWKDKSLDHLSDTVGGAFLEVVGGRHSETLYNSWITRDDDGVFRCYTLYHGIVETIQSKHAATIVIAQKNGISLQWNDTWHGKNVKFGRVLFLVDRLRPSKNEREYGKEAIMYDKLQEGEVVVVEVGNSTQSPDNIFKYFAKSGYKFDIDGKKIENVSMENIRDPLRGIVESVITKDVGVIRFGTYNGRIAKALFTIACLYYKGEKVKKQLPLGSATPGNTLVFLEVTKWNTNEVKQEWEKLLFKDGVIFRATLVWLKDDPRPSRSSAFEKPQKTKYNYLDKVEMTDAGRSIPGRDISHSVSTFGGQPSPGYYLTNLHAYYGVVETFTSSISAVVCTAHRKGEPLDWKANWCAEGVNLDRVFLLASHVRPSKNEPEYIKGIQIRQILKIGDWLRLVVEPTEKSPEKCYKWFTKTSWKVEEGELGMVPINSLSGHLCGVVESVVSHDIGIICFKTYHGISAKAFFTRANFHKDGKTILQYVPLGGEVDKGTEVYLVVDRWHPGSNPNEIDKQMLQKQVCFRAVLVWTRGSSRPNEGKMYTKRGRDRGAFDKESQSSGFERSQFERFSSPNQHVSHQRGSESAGINEKFNMEGRDFNQARGRRQYNRGQGRGRYNKRQQHSGGLRNDSDCHSNCTEDSESCLSDISSLCDYLSETNFRPEDPSEDVPTRWDRKEQRAPSKSSHRNRQADKEHKPWKKNENFGAINNTSYSGHNVPQTPMFIPPSPFKESVNSHLNKGIAGTLISVDENWGLVRVGDSEVHDFQSTAAFLYGLKLENIPLQKLFHQDQSVTVHLIGEKVIGLEYGTPQLPNQMRAAILTYCENNSIPHNVKDMLEHIMQQYGV